MRVKAGGAGEQHENLLRSQVREVAFLRTGFEGQISPPFVRIIVDGARSLRGHKHVAIKEAYDKSGRSQESRLFPPPADDSIDVLDTIIYISYTKYSDVLQDGVAAFTAEIYTQVQSLPSSAAILYTLTGERRLAPGVRK